MALDNLKTFLSELSSELTQQQITFGARGPENTPSQLVSSTLDFNTANNLCLQLKQILPNPDQIRLVKSEKEPEKFRVISIKPYDLEDQLTAVCCDLLNIYFPVLNAEAVPYLFNKKPIKWIVVDAGLCMLTEGITYSSLDFLFKETATPETAIGLDFNEPQQKIYFDNLQASLSGIRLKNRGHRDFEEYYLDLIPGKNYLQLMQEYQLDFINRLVQFLAIDLHFETKNLQALYSAPLKISQAHALSKALSELLPVIGADSYLSLRHAEDLVIIVINNPGLLIQNIMLQVKLQLDKVTPDKWITLPTLPRLQLKYPEDLEPIKALYPQLQAEFVRENHSTITINGAGLLSTGMLNSVSSLLNTCFNFFRQNPERWNSEHKIPQELAEKLKKVCGG